MDPLSLYQAFLSSDTAKDIHTSIIHFVNNPNELYYLLAWLLSIRTTSGQYAHIISNSEDNGKAIFPSDFVYYCCARHKCHCRLPNNSPDFRMHIGRIKAVGKNFTSNVRQYSSEITLLINECIDINLPTFDEEFPGLLIHYQLGHEMRFE